MTQSVTTLLVGISLVVAAILLYERSITIGLLSDDFALYDWALHREFVPASWPYLRPVLLFAWSLLIPQMSLEAGAMALHLASAAAHGLNAFLVYQVANILGVDRTVAVLAAFIFVSHPTAVEAVAWPSAFSDVLLVTWTLGAIIAATRLQSTRVSLVTVGSFSLLAFLTKETAIALPLLYGVVSLNARQPLERRRLLHAAVIAALLGLIYLSSRALLNHWPTRPAITVEHMAVALRDPFVVLAWPFHAHVRAPYHLDRVTWAVASLMLGVLAFWRWSPIRVGQLVGHTSAWVFALVAPTLGRFAITPDLEGTRYLYAASAAWALLLAAVASNHRARGGRAAFVACAVLIGAATTVTWRNQGPWREAADARDAILPVIAGLPSECDRVVLTGLPETIKGVHLARNGVPQALRLVHGRHIEVGRTPADTGAPCRLDFSSFAVP